MKILLVIDDRSILNELRELLNEDKYELVVAESVSRAINLVDNDPSIDMIIFELYGSADGSLRLVRFVRSNPRAAWIPRLAIGHSFDSGIIRRFVQWGVSDIIVFPISREALQARLDKSFLSGRRTVLLVDNEAIVIDILADSLALERFRVLTAQSAEQALELLQSNTVHVLVTDLLLPGMSGLELLVAAKKAYPELPVILITGYAGRFSPESAIAAGADGYFSKPFHNIELIYTLRRVLEPQYRSRRLKDYRPDCRETNAEPH